LNRAQLAWLPELFSEKSDNAAWLSGLYDRKEITSEQHEWLQELFAKKEEEDKENYSDLWWKGNYGGMGSAKFDANKVPGFVKTHSRKFHKKNFLRHQRLYTKKVKTSLKNMLNSGARTVTRKTVKRNVKNLLRSTAKKIMKAAEASADHDTTTYLMV
jgi:hypothetical protein